MSLPIKKRPLKTVQKDTKGATTSLTSSQDEVEKVVKGSNANEENLKVDDLLDEISEEVIEEQDASWLEELETIQSNERTFSEGGALGIVNSEKNGCRVSISKKVLQELGNPEKVLCSIRKIDKSVVISAGVGDANEHTLKGNNKNIVYNKTLVSLITTLWNLNYKSRTSLTLGKVRYLKIDGRLFACITK